MGAAKRAHTFQVESFGLPRAACRIDAMKFSNLIIITTSAVVVSAANHADHEVRRPSVDMMLNNTANTTGCDCEWCFRSCASDGFKYACLDCSAGFCCCSNDPGDGSCTGMSHGVCKQNYCSIDKDSSKV